MSQHKKKAILLINIGTPDAPTKEDVAVYLKEFLNDPLVIQIPSVLRHILVNYLIVPFRAAKSAKRYQQVWTPEGSPLAVQLKHAEEKLRTQVDNKYKVFSAMRYGKPSIGNTLLEISREEIDELIVFPLYPHYALSTTQSTINKIDGYTKNWNKCDVKYVEAYYKQNAFIKAMASTVAEYDLSSYDHIVFSYHSLPIKQVSQTEPNYEVSCYETTDLMAKHLGIEKYRYTTCFQSRMTKNWLSPFTNDIFIKLAKEGKKRIIVITPSFAADCLETVIEIGDEYSDLFKQHGGETLDLVPCLNANDKWIDTMEHIISKL